MEKFLIILSSLILILNTIAMADPAISDATDGARNIQRKIQNTEAEPAKQIENTGLNRENTQTEPEKQTESQEINSQNIENKPVQKIDNDQNIKIETKPVEHKNFLKYLSGIEIFLLPSATFYNDATGIDINLGMLTDMTLFGLTDYKKNFIIGGSGLWHRVSKNDTTFSTFGVYGIAGYQFFLSNYISELPWYWDIRFMPQARAGAMDQNVNGNNGAAVFIAPALIMDIKLSNLPLRLGLDLSYNIFLGDKSLRTVSTGLFISYKF